MIHSPEKIVSKIIEALHEEKIDLFPQATKLEIKKPWFRLRYEQASENKVTTLQLEKFETIAYRKCYLFILEDNLGRKKAIGIREHPLPLCAFEILFIYNDAQNFIENLEHKFQNVFDKIQREDPNISFGQLRFSYCFTNIEQSDYVMVHNRYYNDINLLDKINV